MWTYKSVVILATGDQPDHWFELALVFFGAAVLLLVYAIRDRIERFARPTVILAWAAFVSGALAAIVHVIQGDDGLFGPAALATIGSITITLFLIGGQIHRDRLLPRYSFAPRLLAWSIPASIPLGAALSAVDERLLEVALLVVVAGWVILALGTLGPPRTEIPRM